jgi:hypothetical protein
VPDGGVNGRYDVAAYRPRPVAGCKVISSAESSTPWRAWNPQNDVTADSFRFTLVAEQCGASLPGPAGRVN